ncbi:MAG: bifunctional DNA-formamidopyrimidine glycosylase/DNA-(apurinic or apyrimidinic site) lyase [Clostridiales bacterium]|jgi:formamidopyrimidine-DNA glycosylase|nr:bifunctional DNA-formamidopyrimidine glycosylase/DNA-(apurinic or apyrimidinic site) lyase [Clostridiales bacterium]
MPELPEVETVRISLEPLILGSKILEIREQTAGVLYNWTGQPEVSCGRTVTGLRRRGKYLLLDLGPDLLLIAHLRMTGQFKYEEQPPELRKHDHIVLSLEKPGTGPVWLVFHDTRRFGRIWLLRPDQTSQIAGLSALGPEPLDPQLDSETLRLRLLRHSRTSLKAALLSQTVVAGLGNIYADESLFLSGINPQRLAGSLSPQEAESLLTCMQKILQAAVNARGTSVKDYVDALNVRGSFQYQLQVYGRAGQPCSTCGTTLVKTRLAGRTTVYCPQCQPI